MRYQLYGALACALAATLGCSNLEKLQGKETAKSDDAKAAESDASGATTPTATGSSTAAAGAGETLGLADACKYTASSGGQGCFDCLPREIDLIQCTTVPANFDPTKACTHDANQMSCDVGASAPFVFDLADETAVEKVYDEIPILVFAAKAFLASQLENDPPATMNLVYGALDAVNADKQALFNFGDPTAFINTLGGLVQTADPGITAAELQQTETALTAGVASVQAARKAGTFDDEGFLTFIQTEMGALPQSIVGKVLPDFNVASITQNLQNYTGDSDVIAGLLASLGGGTSIASVLQTLGASGTGGISTGSATATATAQ